MPEIDFERIKKLPPEKRVRVLQEVEEELRKLIEERKNEIEEAEAMLEEAKSELRIIEHIETPQAKAIDVGKLFRPEEEETSAKEISERIAREERTSLEEITAREKIKVAPETARQWTADMIYKGTADIYINVRQTGLITSEQEKRLEYLSAIEQAKREQIGRGEYSPEQTALEKMARAENIAAYLRRDEASAEHYKQK